MKAVRALTIIFISVSLCLIGCSEDDPEISQTEKNANNLNDILKNNTIRWVDIYEYSYAAGEWVLAADNQTYTEGMDLTLIFI